MDIKLIKKNILKIDEFQFKCSTGAGGIKRNKTEGDLCTPKGKFKLKNLFYRADKKEKINCKLNTIKIKKNMGWCDNPQSEFYNKLVNLSKKVKCEKLFRKDYLYDFFIEINHNRKNRPFKGSAIFIHLTKNYKPTKGCIALKEKDFRILLKLLSKTSYLNIS